MDAPPPYADAVRGTSKSQPPPVGFAQQSGFSPVAPSGYNVASQSGFSSVPQSGYGVTPYPQQSGGYPPPAGGAISYPTSGVTTVAPNQGVVVTTTTAQPVVLVRGGNCPRCMTGFIVEDFSCCGIFCAIFFFPLGLICCLLSRRYYCNTCGYTAG